MEKDWSTARAVTDHVVQQDRVHSGVHRQLCLLYEIGAPAGLVRVGQPAISGDVQVDLGRAGIEPG